MKFKIIKSEYQDEFEKLLAQFCNSSLYTIGTIQYSTCFSKYFAGGIIYSALIQYQMQ